MYTLRGVRYGGLALSTMLMLAACEQGGGPTAPSIDGEVVDFQPQYVSSPQVTPVTSVPQSRPYPGTKVAGEASVCKDASSPAGTYTFHVSAANTLSGDLVATSVTLSPGQCSIIYNRVTRTGGANPATSVTITELVPGGATYRLDRVFADDDASASRTVTGPSVTLVVTHSHGGYANFFNVATGTHPAPPPPPPPPPTHPPPPPPPPPTLPLLTSFPGTETPGQIKVCKAGTGLTGSWTFNITSTGLIAGDQVATSATLSAGQCAIVFIRTTPTTANATLTVTEVARAGFTLTNVTKVQSGTTTTVSGTATVSISENTFHGGVLTFNNAVSVTTNFGLGEAAFPGTETPGQAKVCKSSTSPAGLYTFNITAVGTVTGDQVASTITIGPGQCAIVFIRTVTSTSLAVLTVTEVVPIGITVQSITRIQFGSTTILTGQSSATISENTFHGGVLTFNNVLAAA